MLCEFVVCPRELQCWFCECGWEQCRMCNWSSNHWYGERVYHFLIWSYIFLPILSYLIISIETNLILQLLLQINLMQVVEPNCQTATPRSSKEYLQRRYLEENFDESTLLSKTPAYWCRVNLSLFTFYLFIIIQLL